MKSIVEKARNARDIRIIAARCADHPEDFDALVNCMSDADRHTAAWAAWAMSHAVQLRPSILQYTHYDWLIKIAAGTSSSGLKRNIMRAWQSVELPGEHIYDIADIALKFLGSPKEDVAVKAFSITVLQNCLKLIPEIREEVLFLIEKEMPHATAAFIVRARKFQKSAFRTDQGR